MKSGNHGDIPRTMVAMLGSRMHWAVPNILHEAGALSRLFTDFDSRKSWFIRAYPWTPQRLQARLRRLQNRAPQKIPQEFVTSYNPLGLGYGLRRRFLPETEAFLWANRTFGRLVSQADWGDAQACFTYNNAGLEIMQEARKRGVRCVMEQTIAPYRIEREILQREESLHGDWLPKRARNRGTIQAYQDREEAEWQLADLVLCGSPFVQDGLTSLGVPVAKCAVVPYGVPLPSVQTIRIRKRERNDPLRVLFVGTVSLRKGAPYLAKMADQLAGLATFRIVGPLHVSELGQHKLRSVAEVLGAIPRVDLDQHFEWADVFVLPSLCEGSATVTYEALSYGIPVLCTHGSGSIVRHDVDGWILPSPEASLFAEKIECLAQDSALLDHMKSQALDGAWRGSTAAYSKRFLDAISHTALMADPDNSQFHKLN